MPPRSLSDRLKDAARALLDEPTAGPVASRPAPVAEREPPRPEPKAGLQNLVLVVLDSCRWDTWQRAVDDGSCEHLARLGSAQRRYSYASWTAPSHYNLLTGLLPHRSPTGVFASEVYKEEYLAYSERLGTDVEFSKLLPGLWLPGFLRGIGYETGARVSLPVLNPRTGINRDFDSYRLMPKHNDMAAIVDSLHFGQRPGFWMLNIGETHYPYVLAGEDAGDLPHVSGVHGVAKRLGEGSGPVHASEAPSWFEGDALAGLHDRQVQALRGLDRCFEQLFDVVPKGTWVVVTADHGELFGEGGYFGHGPIAHDKVLEVPFVEGLVR